MNQDFLPKKWQQASWPDPAQAYPSIDDVSRFNPTQVERILYVRNKDDLVAVLKEARETGHQVSVRGTKHSMGGQSIAKDAYIVDMTKYCDMSYNPETRIFTTSPGATWSQAIAFLNDFSVSPRTMQSYSSFSIGGTISVNAHGITTDFCLAESVESFDILLADGGEAHCSREENTELFGLAIGGYGLFGIIWRINLKASSQTSQFPLPVGALFVAFLTRQVCNNYQLDLESIHLSVKDFPAIYRGVQASPDVEIKIARLDITNAEEIDLYVFRRSSPPTVSRLPLQPREAGGVSRLIYKWLAPTTKELRYTLEKRTGLALDWSGNNERNLLMFESAQPLARLYEPLLKTDDTFILQEFFVPAQALREWLIAAKPIYAELLADSRLTLLNTTIRFVRHDADTVLAYAQEAEGVFAIVLYYRLPRTEAADAVLASYHRRYAELSMSLGGRFYLPYRHHYSAPDLLRAYPAFPMFVELKRKYDPAGLFTNLWFEHYVPLAGLPPLQRPTLMDTEEPAPGLPSLPELTKALAKLPPPFGERRTDSFKRLMADPNLRRRFFEEFLVNVFNAMPPDTLHRLIARVEEELPLLSPTRSSLGHTDLECFLSHTCPVTFDDRNHDDTQIYDALLPLLPSGPVEQLKRLWSGSWQIREQKEEFTKELVALLTHLGKLGHLKDLVSIGDHGKLVQNLAELGLTRAVVVHDHLSDEIPAVLERGCVQSSARFVPIDYEAIGHMNQLADESADLVTMLQGLHHLPQSQLAPFLHLVARILRPGGLFIVREHNASAGLIPMLDMAHMIFNAVTGVSGQDERGELRAFRSVLNWRELVEKAGLRDCMIYEIQGNDPTLDEMMCFYKPPLRVSMALRDSHTDSLAVKPAPATTAETTAPVMLPQLTALMKEIPAVVLRLLAEFVAWARGAIPNLTEAIKDAAAQLSSGQQYVIGQVLDNFVSTADGMLGRFAPYLDSAAPAADLPDLVPAELWLIVPALLNKVQKGTATPFELAAAAFVKDLQEMLAARPDDNTPARSSTVPSQGQAAPSPATSTGLAVEVVETELKAIYEALPELREQGAAGLGLGLFAQRALNTVLQDFGGDEAGLQKAATWLAGNLTPESWAALRAPLQRIKREHIMPQLASLEDDRAPWSVVLATILSSPRVYLTPRTVRQMDLVGLGVVGVLWRKAQEQRRQSLSSQPAIASVQLLLRNLSHGKEISLEMAEGHLQDIADCAEIISAEYGYESLTASYNDVAGFLGRYLEKGKNRLSLKNVDLTADLRTQPEFSHIGSWKDEARRATLGKQRMLKIRYRSSRMEDISAQLPRLLAILSESGIVRNLTGPSAEARTWYKLSEWMQVELVQMFGSSMEHTPWYRFPFLEMMRVYFKVLLKEFHIVSERHGLSTALFNEAFLTDLIPGLVMTAGFAQLQVLAQPLKMFLGDSYENESMFEEVVVLLPAPTDAWPDRRIKAQHVADGLYVLTIPTFKAFTEILTGLAVKMSAIRFLQISNQSHIQVQVFCEDEAAVKSVKDSGVQVKFEYNFPTERRELCLSLGVDIPDLAGLLRTLARLPRVKVHQIYDFWG